MIATTPTLNMSLKPHLRPCASLWPWTAIYLRGRSPLARGKECWLLLVTMVLWTGGVPREAQAGLRPAMEPPVITIKAPPVITPPESFFQMVSNRIAHADRGRRRGGTATAAEALAAAEPDAVRQKRIDEELALYRSFYKKYINVRGMPVVAHQDVADLALQRTYDIVTHMLAGRRDILEAMVNHNTCLIIIGKHQVYTDMPEYRHHPDPAFVNERVRGTGGNPTSFGEENLLSLPLDRYDDESIAVHEFAHTIDSTLRRMDATWIERMDAAYHNARALRLYELAYANINPAEYWAEIVQAYFDCNRVNNWNHGPVGNRAQLKAHDPAGYELCRSTFNLGPDQDWRYTWLQPLPMVSQIPRTEMFQDIDPWYARFTWAREFTVLGRDVSDDALLHANETIRRMFAYRHDILKALIAGGVRLVVLGPREQLADLPEFRDASGSLDVAPGSRFLAYRPESRLLVVAQENVLADPAAPGADDNQVIRVFADALYQVAGLRQVIPDYRGNQQYELRLERMDVRFDEAVMARFAQASKAGKWKGTPASEDKFAYWTAGVLAYFDAAGGTETPADGRSPVRTREQLVEYDPGLFDLVHQTMAYQGRVDWRLGTGKRAQN
jgi:hypothetical protein